MYVNKALLLALGLAVTAPIPGFARSSAAAAGKVEGTLTAINTSATPPTVTIAGRNTVTLNVTPATKVEIGEAHAALTDLVVGGRAEAKFDPATMNAIQIEEAAAGAVTPPVAAREVEAVGKVLSADANAGQLALDVNGDGVVDATLVVNAGTEIRLGDFRLTAAQLALLDGLTVKAEFNGTTFVARELKAATTGATTLTGTFQSFDPTTGALVLNTASGPVTLIVPAVGTVKIGKTGLAALAAGTPLQVLQLVNGDGTRVVLDLTAKAAKGNKGPGKGAGKSSGSGADDPAGDDHGGHGGHGGDDGAGHH